MSTQHRVVAERARLPAVARLSDAEGAAALSAASGWYASHDEAATFDRALEICNHEQLFDAIVIDTARVDVALEWLRELRGNARLGHRPIYLTRDLGVEAAAIADGIVPTPTALRREIDSFNSRCQTLTRTEFADEEQRLLAHLYLRPDLQITPIVDIGCAGYYRYPLLDAFTPSGTDGLSWTEGLRRRGLLEEIKLIDRLRKCPTCAASHLNYVDICPECKQLDIGENIFLHCHTCGFVAPQENFIARTGLTCGKCDARLRHIGVDYDRALECFSCNACTARFIEPQIEARCLQCRAGAATTELPEIRIYSYRLSDSGRVAARSGSLGHTLATHDTQRNLTSAYFEQTLTWMLQLRQRHADVQFALAAVRVTNTEALEKMLSHLRAVQLVDAFARRLSETLRATDLIMRSGEYEWFILSPQNDRAGLLMLLQLIEKLAAATEQSDGNRIEVTANCVTSEEIKDLGIGARVLLSELQGGTR